MNIQFDWRFDEDMENRATDSWGERHSLVRNWLVGLCNRLRHHPDRIELTPRQCRLHAAVARTRPWDCPYGRPE